MRLGSVRSARSRSCSGTGESSTFGTRAELGQIRDPPTGRMRTLAQEQAQHDQSNAEAGIRLRNNVGTLGPKRAL
jgi:hypothetical protein